MKKLFIVLYSLITLEIYAQNNNPPCLAADIILLTDMSSSMQGAEVLVGEAVSVLIEGIPPEDTRIQFAVVSFGDVARTEIPLTFDYPKLLLSVEEYKKKNATGSSTYLVPGIQLSRKILKDSENSVEHLRIIIVLTDGDIHDDEGLGEFIDSVSDSDGILFFTLGFGSEKIIPDIKDPLFRSMYLSYMDINDSLLIRISNGQYFQNNTFRLRDTIRKLGACL